MSPRFPSTPEPILARMSPCAVLALPAGEIATALGLPVRECVDGDESCSLAVTQILGERVALVRHHRLPEGATQLYLTDRRGHRPDRTRARIDAVLLALGLSEAPLAWRRGDPMTA